MEGILLDTMFDLPGLEGVEEVVINAEVVDPVLPLRDIVVFPHMIVPLFVGREKSCARSKR
jgi:ATP-dependent protease Clp ATPase subunit